MTFAPFIKRLLSAGRGRSRSRNPRGNRPAIALEAQ